MMKIVADKCNSIKGLHAVKKGKQIVQIRVT